MQVSKKENKLESKLKVKLEGNNYYASDIGRGFK